MADDTTERHDGQPILIVHDHHIPGEPPPHLDGDVTYPVFYFQGDCGDQWLVWWDQASKRAYLAGGDVGWERYPIPEDRDARARHQRLLEAIVRGEQRDAQAVEDQTEHTLSSLVLGLEEQLSLAGALVSMANQIGGKELAEDAYRMVEHITRIWTEVYRKAWKERLRRGAFERTREIWDEYHAEGSD
jgi:hypothetical protein